MFRAKIALLLLSGFVAATGCRMCANPYDCNGPTWQGQPGEPTWEFERAGSAFSGYHGMPADGVIVEGEYESLPSQGTPSEALPSAPTPSGSGNYYPEGMTQSPSTNAPRSVRQPARSALQPRR